jgi:formimidoylglutamate deiminase
MLPLPASLAGRIQVDGVRNSAGTIETMSGGATEQSVHADWTWVDGPAGGRLERGIAVAIGSDGRIGSVGPAARPSTLRLGGKALLPGFVSAHSHAFQRGLRGRTERFERGVGGFFPWREAMYGLVAELTPERCHELSLRTFTEMRDAGITAVGEFHYVRHAGPGDGGSATDKGLRYAFDESVLAAARDAGIRLTLLHACYMVGGMATDECPPLTGGQLRFRTADEGEYWDRFERLAGLCRGPNQSVGVTAHSLRAVPIDIIARLHAESVRRGVVFHIHLEEVRQEIIDALRVYRRRPAQLLLERLRIDRRFTAVHCTHTEPEDLRALAAAGATICLCPLTEGNLGDGICDVPAFREAGGRLAFGSDLNSRLAPLEELRWLEYVQRIRHERRGCVLDADGDAGKELLRIGTAGGAESIGLDSGAIAPGRWADFAVVDLQHPTMEGWTPETFAAHLVFGAGDNVLCGSCVGGHWRLRR